MEIKIVTDLSPDLWEGLFSPSPFQTFWYLNLFSKHFHAPAYLLQVKDGENTLALIPFELQEERIIVLGMKKVLGTEEVTDYSGMASRPMEDLLYVEMVKEIVVFLRAQGIREVSLDYVREDSRLYRYLHVLHHATSREQVVAPSLALPATWEEYLAGLDRVERKELKRKLRRLDTIPHSFEIIPSADDSAIGDFIRLQRASDVEKEEFMSGPMESFFRDMAHIVKDKWPGFFANLKIEGKPAASIFFFEQDTSVMLYNSGFDPQFGYYSNGLMAHSLLIKRNIESGRKVHDFMRGNERYKYDLGAKDVNLYKISIIL